MRTHLRHNMKLDLYIKQNVMRYYLFLPHSPA
jgi:hypothetical protein